MNSNFIKVCTMIIGLLMCLSCASHRAGVTYRANANCQVEMPAYHQMPAEIEKDDIFSLVAYAVVFKGWQQSKSMGRGYNIGSVLVDENYNIVCWARNAVNITKNNTQHGELRLMLNYLHNCRNVFSLPKYRLYTTLEPCAMCSGMMTLNELFLTVYGQKDHGYGDAIQRLELNSTSCGGFKPYPRPVISVINQTDIPGMLDEAYVNSGIQSITEWLATDEAKSIFKQATRELYNYKPQYPKNIRILRSASDFLQGVPNDFAGFLYKVNCSNCPGMN